MIRRPPRSTLFPYPPLSRSSISTAAGAQHGQLVGPAELRRLVRDAGRLPAQRDTLYAIVQIYRDGEDPESPLDRIDDAEADRKSTRLNSSHDQISYAVFCLK